MVHGRAKKIFGNERHGIVTNNDNKVMEAEDSGDHRGMGTPGRTRKKSFDPCGYFRMVYCNEVAAA